jgi:hypothetical protein
MWGSGLVWYSSLGECCQCQRHSIATGDLPSGPDHRSGGGSPLRKKIFFGRVNVFLGVPKSDHPENWFSGFHFLDVKFCPNPMRYPICCQNCSETVKRRLSAVMVQLVSLWPRHPAFGIRTVLTLFEIVKYLTKSEIFFLAGRFSRSPCEITPRCRVFIPPEGRALSNGTTRSL